VAFRILIALILLGAAFVAVNRYADDRGGTRASGLAHVPSAPAPMPYPSASDTERRS
jgi:hypothetical protein